MNFRHPLLHLSAVIGLLAFSGCAVTADKPDGKTREPAKAAAEPVQRFESDDATAQYHVLAGEMAANRDQPELAAQEFLKALEYVDDPDLASRATSLAVATHDDALALKAARRWLQIEPSSMDAREVITRSALTRGDTAEALAQTREMISGHAGGEDEGFHHVAVLLSQLDDKQADAAIALIQQLVAQWPQLPAAHHALGLVALRFGKLEQADSAARKALALAPNDKEQSLLLVGVLIKQDRLDESGALLEKLVKGDPKATELRMGYAKLLLESGKRDAARAQLKKVLDGKPAYDDARFALGVLALNDRDYDTAEKYLTPLLGGDRAQDAAMQLGRLEELRKHYDKAIAYYSRVTTGLQSLDAVTRRASVMGRAGQVDEAQSLMRQLRDNFPQLATRFYLAEGEMLLSIDGHERALKMYALALQEFPSDADLLYGRSLVHERLGQIEPAEKDLRAILADNAEDSRAMNALGYMLTVHTQRYDEARKLIARAHELDPDDAAIIDSLGWINYKLGDRDTARQFLQKAFDKFPDPEVAAHLGEVLWTSGDKEHARKVWDAALKEDPEHRVLRETVQRLTQ
ncbi:MAG TPA: tetratricopeptide repeat protein [Solimonas sp.]|nr:tetratricopeptide repeat protein [Solimonas sp.]